VDPRVKTARAQDACAQHASAEQDVPSQVAGSQPAWTPDDDSQDQHDQYQHGPSSRRLISARPWLGTVDWRMWLLLWRPRLRKLTLIGGTLGVVVLTAMIALWWRLSSGPIELDIATPWLTAAIKENFGSGHEVEIGGTQLSWCVTPKARSWRARRRPRSASPVPGSSPAAFAPSV
jgi:hypothetical protein